MEALEKRYNTTLKALATLEHELMLAKNPKYEELHETIRNSIIQSFEYSLDTFWKFIKNYLQDKLGINLEVISPKATIRNCLEAKIISAKEMEMLNKAIDDRNMTSHTYNEELAEKIVQSIPQYYHAMHTIMQRITL